MHRIFLIFALLAISSLKAQVAFPREDGVIGLTEDTIEEALKTIPNLIIKFYAPWCPHCKHLAPEYIKAAKHPTIKKLGVEFAEVDADFSEAVRRKYYIRGFPILNFYKNGNLVGEYDGQRTAEGFVRWFKKRLLSPCDKVETAEQIKTDFEDKEEISLIYFGNNKEDIKTIENFSVEDNNHNFGIVSDQSLMKKYGVKEGTLMLFKPFDEKKIAFEGKVITKDGIQGFINENKFPMVIEDANKIYEVAFGRRLTTLFIFRNEKAKDANQVTGIVKKLGKKYKGKINFALLDSTSKDAEDYSRNLELKLSQTEPVAAIRDYQRRRINNWKFEDKFTEMNIERFIKNYLDGKYVAPFKSEPVPEKQDKPVYQIVQKTFEKEVIQSDKDVLVKFYAPYCGHCKALAPAYEKMARSFENIKDKVVIAEYNMVDNDFDSKYATIDGYPTIILWKAKDKKNPVIYSGNRSASDLERFVRQNAYHTQNNDKKEEPKKEVKSEPKKEQVKAEPKKEQAKAEPKKEQVKVEPKKEQVKVEPKKEQAKVEPKKEEVKTEPKKEQVKVESKKEEVKAEPKKEEIKKEAKKEEKKEEKKEVKKEEPKKEEKKEVKKEEPKKEEKKEVKKEEPKKEEKKEVKKEEPKKEEKKEVKKEEPKKEVKKEEKKESKKEEKKEVKKEEVKEDKKKE